MRLMHSAGRRAPALPAGVHRKQAGRNSRRGEQFLPGVQHHSVRHRLPPRLAAEQPAEQLGLPHAPAARG
jgi:hypothetical protein